MMHFGGSWMDAILWQVRTHRDLLPKDQADERSIERALAKLKNEVEPQLEARLEASEYICGHKFSAADIVNGHNVAWARLYGTCQQEVFAAYVERLAERPAYRRAFDDAMPAGD